MLLRYRNSIIKRESCLLFVCDLLTNLLTSFSLYFVYRSGLRLSVKWLEFWVRLRLICTTQLPKFPSRVRKVPINHWWFTFCVLSSSIGKFPPLNLVQWRIELGDYRRSVRILFRGWRSLPDRGLEPSSMGLETFTVSKSRVPKCQR